MQPSQFNLQFKQFKEEYIRELENKLWLTGIEIEVNKEILAEQEGRLERMKSQAEICANAIIEFQKDPSREAREKRKAEEDKLREWEEKIKWQTMEIIGGKIGDKIKIGTKQKLESFEDNIRNLELYLKKVK